MVFSWLSHLVIDGVPEQDGVIVVRARRQALQAYARTGVSVRVTFTGGSEQQLGRADLLAPIERELQ
jgi:hypothetical protein